MFVVRIVMLYVNVYNWSGVVRRNTKVEKNKKQIK